MIFNNQLFIQESAFDRELHASDQSVLMVVQEELEILVNSIVYLLSFAQLNSRCWYSCSSRNNSIELKICECTGNCYLSYRLRPSTWLFLYLFLKSRGSPTLVLSFSNWYIKLGIGLFNERKQSFISRCFRICEKTTILYKSQCWIYKSTTYLWRNISSKVIDEKA